MILVANLMYALGHILSMILTLYMWIFVARAILSWVSPDPRNPIVNFINRVTDPILWRVRSKVPPMGMLDLSVMVVILGLIFLDLAIAGSLVDYSIKLKQSSF